MSGVINGDGNNNNLSGGSGANTINGLGGDDVIEDLGGNDWIDGGLGADDIVDKGTGNDTITVGGNTFGTLDKVVTEGGNDIINVQNAGGKVDVTTGAGNDQFYWDGSGQGGVEHNFQANEGNDTLYYGGAGMSASRFQVTLNNSSAGPGDGGYIRYDADNNGSFTDPNDTVVNFQKFESLVFTNTAPPCFTTGTRVATTRGEVAVEDLRVGDLVLTPRAGAKVQPIIWIGHTRVNVAAHPNRATVAPILVKAGAIAEGVPHRDLRVSPEHAFFVDGRLVPAKLLVNGSSIVQEAWCPQVTYWHVELPQHAVIVSEGAPTESYFDDGSRQNFDNGAIAALFKDFESHRGNGRYDADACYPVLRAGTMLEIIRGRLVARAADLERRARATG
jgi:hypothetical protein